MPFNRPSLPSLINRTTADVQSRLEGADARLRWVPERVLATAVAGATHELHGHVAWAAKQAVPSLESDIETLERWGAFYGVSRKAPTSATGRLTVKGLTGTVLPAGTAYQRNDGAVFVTDEAASMTGSFQVVSVTAAIAGEAGNTDAFTVLTIVSPISGMQSTGTVASDELTGGFDRESKEDYFARLQDQIRQQGVLTGKAGDYRLWALEVAGVTRAWERPLALGAGSVSVYVMTDSAEDPFPDTAFVAGVKTYIEERAPVTTRVHAFAPTEVALNPSIKLTTATNTTAVKNAVAKKIEELVRITELGGLLFLSQLNEVISQAEGEVDHVLLSPTANIHLAPGELLSLGTITWVAP